MPARVVASATSISVSLGSFGSLRLARSIFDRLAESVSHRRDIYRGSRVFRDSLDPAKSSRGRVGVDSRPPEGTGFAKTN